MPVHPRQSPDGSREPSFAHGDVAGNKIIGGASGQSQDYQEHEVGKLPARSGTLSTEDHMSDLDFSVIDDCSQNGRGTARHSNIHTPMNLRTGDRIDSSATSSSQDFCSNRYSQLRSLAAYQNRGRLSDFDDSRLRESNDQNASEMENFEHYASESSFSQNHSNVRRAAGKDDVLRVEKSDLWAPQEPISSTKHKAERFYSEIMVYDKAAQKLSIQAAILDTGSDFNLIDRVEAEELAEYATEMYDRQMVVRSICDEELNLIGAMENIHVRFLISDMPACISFYVVEKIAGGAYAMLLGVTTIRRLQLLREGPGLQPA